MRARLSVLAAGETSVPAKGKRRPSSFGYPAVVQCRFAHVGAVALALSAAACTGFIDSVDGSEGSTRGGPGASGGGSSASGGTTGISTEQCTSESDSSPIVLRRLSKLEYELTLQELFQLAEPPDVTAVPEDSDQGGFRTIA
jgi:hypothetical protein